ncbi:conserved hypothetical protein [Crenothrix polyspora]|uniref:DUF1640 domain-containing protein n=1 Tax=Crenothrix polyspora TaxID=360316 RepID=A0A1R4HBZ5_9GAMM|nr:DUF1640 domain-containing protein [Crenothrix polyspora]SJM93561.1 conserved hypothetical protein [Crenothrix polyspora]
MTAFAFDTHEFVKKLKGVGFSEEQAEILTDLQKATVQNTLEQARHDYDLDNLTTKRDLKELELKLEARIKDVELKIAETKAELIRWVIAVGLLQTVLISALLLKLSGMH